MNWCRCLLAGALVIAFASPAPAQIFGKKTPKVNPAVRVPELIATVQQDPDERKRSSAADELRQFSAQEFPDIVPVLSSVLKKDTSASVRLDAASSLSKIRPATKAAHDALENAANHDGNWRVRLSARSSLMFYHVPNEATVKKAEPQGPILGNSTPEPPLFDPNAVTPTKAPMSAIPVSNPGRLQPTAVPVPSGPAVLQPVPPAPAVLIPTNPQPVTSVPPLEGPILTPPPR